MSDQPSIVFPPFNHEGIHLHLHNHREIDVDPTTLPSPVSTPRSRPEQPTAVGWWDVGIQVLQFKFQGVVSLIRCFCMNRRLLWSNFTLAGFLLLFYLRFRAFRRRLRRESIVQLIRVIKEKDEKILQLLQQIAKMNELLLATHHGVPITSKASSA